MDVFVQRDSLSNHMDRIYAAHRLLFRQHRRAIIRDDRVSQQWMHSFRWCGHACGKRAGENLRAVPARTRTAVDGENLHQKSLSFTKPFSLQRDQRYFFIRISFSSQHQAKHGMTQAGKPSFAQSFNIDLVGPEFRRAAAVINSRKRRRPPRRGNLRLSFSGTFSPAKRRQ